MASKKENITPLSYSEASERLEAIVYKIEQQSPSIDELTALVAEAVELTKVCKAHLERTDKELSTLIAELDEGENREEESEAMAATD